MWIGVSPILILTALAGLHAPSSSTSATKFSSETSESCASAAAAGAYATARQSMTHTSPFSVSNPANETRGGATRGCVSCDDSEGEPDCDFTTDIVNGGCNSNPPRFSSIICGQSVCGSSGASGVSRDTDWWLVHVDAPGAILTWTVTAEFPLLCGFSRPPCPQLYFIGDPVVLDACQTATVVSGCMPPGDYICFVSPSTFSNVPCGSQYTATLSCEPCDAPGPSANDDCNNAIEIPCPSVTLWNNTGASSDGLVPSCSVGGAPTNASHWFTFRATQRAVTIDLCGGGSLLDSVVSLYTGPDCTSLTEIACNDDHCSLLSSVYFGNLTIDQMYWIRVASWNNAAQGTYTLRLQCDTPCGLPQPGDILEGEPICHDQYRDVHNAGCDSSPPSYTRIECGQSVAGEAGTFTFNGVSFRDTDWWIVTVPAPGAILTWTVNAEFPLRIGFLHQPCPQPLLWENAFGDPCQEASITSACLPPGDYVCWVAPSIFSGLSCGVRYRGTLTCTPCTPPPPPPNDTCENATSLLCSAFVFNSNVGATDDYFISDCDFMPVNSQVWYKFTATTPKARIYVTICPDGPSNVIISVLDACGGSELDCYGPNTPACGNELELENLNLGQTYYISVGGPGQATTGPFSLHLACPAAPAPPINDDCADALPILCGQTLTGTNLGATTDGGVGCPNAHADVWYRFIATADTATADTCDASINDIYDTVLAIHDVCHGNQLACNDNSCSQRSSVTVTGLNPGDEYLIRVASRNPPGFNDGTFHLRLTCPPLAGACCLPGECFLATEGHCTALGGEFHGPGSRCGTISYFVIDTSDPFEDISASGTLAPNASNCDDCSDIMPLGFEMDFFTHRYSSVRICSNGFLSFDLDGPSSFTNRDPPRILPPNDLICTFWDDFNPLAHGDVYYQAAGQPRRFVVQWDRMRRYGENAGENTFQAILYPNGEIDFRYREMEGDLLTGSVGLENFDGTRASLTSSNEQYGHRARHFTPVRTSYPCTLCMNPGGTGNFCSADIDLDCQVGLSDLARLLSSFGLVASDPGYAALVDFDASGAIDLADLAVVLAQFGDDCGD